MNRNEEVANSLKSIADLLNDSGEKYLTYLTYSMKMNLMKRS